MNGKDLLAGINYIAKEKNISEDQIFDFLETALAAAYKRHTKSSNACRVVIDKDTGSFRVFSYVTVVDDDAEEIDFDTEIIHEQAVLIVPGIEVGETIEEEVTPEDFSRVAASTAKQVLTGKIREMTREMIYEEYKDKVGELVVGTILMEDYNNYYIELPKINALLPKQELIPGETIVVGNQIKAVIKNVEQTTKGPSVVLSRKENSYLKRLIERAIPEFEDGILYLYNIAREPGSRSKIAVYSENPNVDPLGACIGERGVRISSIIADLAGEKVDLVKYDKDPQVFIQNALLPARDLQVLIFENNDQEAVVVTDESNFSLAIGKKGQNVRLAAHLTRRKIDVKTKEQLEKEGIKLL